LSAQYRSDMVSIAIERKWKVGAELGLGAGVLFEMFLREVPGLHVVGVDHFIRQDRRSRVMSIANNFSRRCTIYAMKTAEAARLVEDESLDFVFIDASHKYGCVRNDIRLWWSKVRSGGWLGGHDYGVEYPGVLNAVNERFDTSVTISDSRIWSVEKP
jgi:predicted O-methyltransferase YrrM